MLVSVYWEEENKSALRIRKIFNWEGGDFVVCICLFVFVVVRKNMGEKQLLGEYQNCLCRRKKRSLAKCDCTNEVSKQACAKRREMRIIAKSASTKRVSAIAKTDNTSLTRQHASFYFFVLFVYTIRACAASVPRMKYKRHRFAKVDKSNTERRYNQSVIQKKEHMCVCTCAKK